MWSFKGDKQWFTELKVETTREIRQIRGNFKKKNRRKEKKMTCQKKERYKEMQEWKPKYINIPDTVISIRRLVPSKARVYCTWSKVRFCAMICQGMMGKKWMRANSKRWAVGIDLQGEWYRWPNAVTSRWWKTWRIPRIDRILVVAFRYPDWIYWQGRVLD